MRFPTPLVPARLLRRYKRFLADARLEESGEEVTAHCANPGAMTGLAEPGMRIWLEASSDPKRKLRWSWKLVELEGGHFAGIDTVLPNRLVAEALRDGALAELAPWVEQRREVKYGERSRVDFLLSGPGLPDLYLEVKNAHLSRAPGLAEFPDARTERGRRHLEELARMRRAGHEAVMLFVVQRTDCDRFALAADIDPAYAEAFAEARRAGVKAICHDTRISPEGISLGRPLPMQG